MKDGWERHKEVIKFNRDDLQEIIKLYDPVLQLTNHELLSGGLSHTNFKVFTDSDDHPSVVRISRDKDNLRMEHNIHKLLNRNESIPEFYHIGEYEGLGFGVMEWKSGVLLKDKLSRYDPSDTYNAGHALGCQLGSLRQFQFEKAGFLDSDLNVTEIFNLTPEVFLSTMEYLILQGKATQWLDEGLPDELMNFCNKHAQILLADKSGSRLVHGDFNGLNILMDNTSVSAILDWEFCFAGSMFMDVGNLLRYEVPNFHEFEMGLQSGLIESGEQLPEEWIQIAKLADLIALCSMLDNDFGGTNRVRDINRLIRNTLGNKIFS